MKAAVLLVAALAGGCLRDTEFHCTSDAQCGTDGQCESASGYCSVPDTNCVYGRRYAAFSGALTNRCVTPIDAGVDTGMGCAPMFSALPGVPGHLYYLFTTTSDFTSQRTACAAQGGITYLAIPDDANELQALYTLAAQPAVWVGIDDEVVEGNYLTVRGQPATFLPWAASQPDNAPPGEDCVAAISASTLDDQQCTNKLRAICECEP